MIGHRRRNAPFIGLLAALAALAGCIAGPFERANPHDPETELTMSIVGGVDTVYVEGTYVFYQLATTPPVTGYTTIWSSNDGRVGSMGSGKFFVYDVPASPVVVSIIAQLGTHMASRLLVLAPAP